MTLYGFKAEDIARIAEAVRAHEQSEPRPQSMRRVSASPPTDPMRLVRALEDINGGGTGLFQFISGDKGAETDTDEDPVEMWSPPGVDWSGTEENGPDSDKGYALYIDSGWEVGRRSCPE